MLQSFNTWLVCVCVCRTDHTWQFQTIFLTQRNKANEIEGESGGEEEESQNDIKIQSRLHHFAVVANCILMEAISGNFGMEHILCSFNACSEHVSIKMYAIYSNVDFRSVPTIFSAWAQQK